MDTSQNFRPPFELESESGFHLLTLCGCECVFTTMSLFSVWLEASHCHKEAAFIVANIVLDFVFSTWHYSPICLVIQVPAEMCKTI